MQMDRSLVHLPAGTPVCSISVHPTLPAQWLLSRCKTGALPIIVQLPAMQQVPLHAHFLRCGWRTHQNLMPILLSPTNSTEAMDVARRVECNKGKVALIAIMSRSDWPSL